MQELTTFEEKLNYLKRCPTTIKTLNKINHLVYKVDKKYLIPILDFLLSQNPKWIPIKKEEINELDRKV